MNSAPLEAAPLPDRRMRVHRLAVLALAWGITLFCPAQAFAQQGPNPGPEAGVGAEEGTQARVAAYLLSPEAQVAGVLLEDGRELHVPPRFGSALARLVAPGQRVKVSPRPREDAPRGGLAVDITALESGRSLADMPAGPEASDRRTPLQPLHVQGVVRQRLHGPRGDVNGVLLASGVQVAFPPHVATELGAWLDPGQTLWVDGYGRTSEFGTVVQATTVRAPGQSPVQVYGPPARP